MKNGDSLNLSEVCGPMPSGGDLAGSGYDGNLKLTVTGVLSWSGPMRWGVRVEKPKVTASGRKGKPESVFLLVANDDQTVPDLLRSIADVWEQGDVEVGKSYPKAAS